MSKLAVSNREASHKHCNKTVMKNGNKAPSPKTKREYQWTPRRHKNNAQK